MASTIIRKAKKQDLEFICEAIVASEKSGSEILGYSAILGISEIDFKAALIDFFDEEIEDQPWHIDHWIVAEIEETPVAGLSVWIEGKNGISSDFAKAQLLNFQFSHQFKQNSEALIIVNTVSIPRLSGHLQLEHLYTLDAFRGKGIMRSLIEFAQQNNEGFDAEIQVLQNNSRAMSFYEYIGFRVNEIKCNPKIIELNLLADSCKVQLIKHGSRPN